MVKVGGIVTGAMVGAAVAALAVLLAFPAVDPSVWREVASATGIRGDGAITPVLWRTLVGAGVPLTVIGAVGIGLFACAFFDALRRTLLILVPAAEFPKWWTRTVPLAAFAGTLLAVFADPVWRLALTGGPALLELALMAASVDLYLTRFFVCTDVDPRLLEEDEAELRRVSLKANAGAYAAFMQMTDEEGLAIALRRADFTEARRFAFGVLKRNPKNAAANFGVGMSYLLENKLDGALPYLEAAKLAPDVPEVKETLKRVREAARR